MFLLLFYGSTIVAQNCQVNGPISINSQGVTEITFDVSGLTDSDLSGDQALCLVEVGFSHNSISTMEMDITSPAGQTIQLIGPANANSLGSTQFISWDVTFAASNYPTIPDDGFGDVWDNGNAWQAFENYDGRYRPFQGNLEDMDMGSANGIWTIRIEDLSQFGNGTLDFVKISFCEASGQSCNACFAEAGYFDQVASQVFCVNDPLLSSDSYFTVLNDGASFNNDIYNFAIADGDDILTIGTDPDLSALAVGEYTLCGVINSQNVQEDIIAFTSLDALGDSFTDGTYCGAVMRNCMQIRIEEPQSTETITEEICPGEVITIDGLNFYQTVDTTVYAVAAGECSSAKRYIVNQIDVESVIISSTNTIDCNGSLILNGSTSSGSNYSWTTESGSFENVGSGPVATINEPGLYFLEVSNGNCSDISSISILPGNDFSNTIELTADSLGCNNSVVTINTNITGDYDSFTWSGPGISDPNQLNPNVDAPGVYTITVNSSGSACGATSNSIVVAQSNMAATPLFNNLAPLECNGFAQLQVVNQIDAAEAAWTDEDGDTLSTNPIAFNVPGPGEYTYSYIDGFGCAGSASTNVEANYNPLEYTVTIDSLTCGDFEGQIHLDITSGNVESYFWIGPATTFFFDEDPEIEFPGNYQLLMTGADGCVTRDTVVVDYDSAAFNFNASVPKITCAQTETEIMVFGPSNWGYEWERENDASFTAPEENTITVDQGGIYFVTITRPSDGCTTQEWTLVQTDTLPADLTFDIEKIDCDTDEILLESNANGFGLLDFAWEGPAITPANETDIFPLVDMIGDYVISGISGNGCDFQDTVTVEQDFSVISLSLENETQPLILDCSDLDKTAVIQATRAGAFTWTTPSGIMNGPITDTRLILDIDEVGEYVIDVVAPDNGCDDQLIIEVIYGEEPPTVELTASSLNIDCINTEIGIDANGVWDDFEWISHPIFTEENITATEEGEYILEVRNLAGCTATDTVMITDDRRIIDLSLTADTITCVNVQSQIQIDTEETDIASYQWEGPQGDLGSDPNLIIDEIETFTVTITGADGCTGEASISIESDTTTTDFTILGIAEITCADDAIGAIEDFADIDDYNFTWMLDGAVEAEGIAPTLSNGGMYTVIATGVNGCTSSEEVEVLENKEFPEIVIEPDSINCNNSIFELEAEIIVGSSPVFEWDGPDEDLTGSTDAMISGDTAGIYYVTVTDANECAVVDSVEVVGDFEAESTFADNLFLSCSDPVAQASLINFDPTVNSITIIDPNGQELADYTDDISVIGEYTIETIGENGCIGETVFNAFGDLEAPEVSIDSVNINCQNTVGMVSIIVPNNVNVDSYEWISPTGPLSEDGNEIMVTETGLYEAIVTGLNGCSDTLSANIEVDTVLPVIALEQTGLLGCASTEATIDASNSEGEILAYNWSSVDGLIVHGEEAAELLVGSPGTYSLTLTDQTNECVSEESITIEDSSATVEIVVDTMGITCIGQATGQINIADASGGFEPYMYSIDGGQSFSDEPLFDALPAGEYDVIVADSIGCSATGVYTLSDGAAFTLDLGQDTTIALGNTYNFMPISTAQPSDVMIEWETNFPGYECDNCWNHEVIPLNTTIYTMTITDQFNCVAKDTLILQVVDTVQVFIPNIVDLESVTEAGEVAFNAGPGVESVSSWMILDRWGNIMHHEKGFLPNDDVHNWDGTNNGVAVVPGVYLYIAEVVLINGDIRKIVGDITVIR